MSKYYAEGKCDGKIVLAQSEMEQYTDTPHWKLSLAAHAGEVKRRTGVRSTLSVRSERSPVGFVRTP